MSHFFYRFCPNVDTKDVCGVQDGQRTLWAELEEQRITTNKILRLNENKTEDGELTAER